MVFVATELSGGCLFIIRTLILCYEVPGKETK